jgi:hypothetical protein
VADTVPTLDSHAGDSGAGPADGALRAVETSAVIDVDGQVIEMTHYQQQSRTFKKPMASPRFGAGWAARPAAGVTGTATARLAKFAVATVLELVVLFGLVELTMGYGFEGQAGYPTPVPAPMPSYSVNPPNVAPMPAPAPEPGF